MAFSYVKEKNIKKNLYINKIKINKYVVSIHLLFLDYPFSSFFFLLYTVDLEESPNFCTII